MSKSHIFIDSRSSHLILFFLSIFHIRSRHPTMVVSGSIWDLSIIHLCRSPIAQKLRNLRSWTQFFHILLTLNGKPEPWSWDMAFLCTSWAVSCVPCWLSLCFHRETDPTQELQTGLSCLKHDVLQRWEWWYIYSVLDPGLCVWLCTCEFTR